MKIEPTGYRIGIDVGGTFTDLVLSHAETGVTAVVKLLNRHMERTDTVIEGITRLLKDTELGPEAIDWINHGTTIATNAVIERTGAKTALVTNRNFRDILEIGRFARPAELIYQVHDDKPAPLVPRRLRLGLDCRIDRHGGVLSEIRQTDLDELIEKIRAEGVESVAVCFLFSFLNPSHEERVGAKLNAAMPRLEVVLSSHILREFREYPRTSTTVFAAYVAPILRRYISSLTNRLEKRVPNRPLYIFQSNGGVARPQIVMRNPAQTLLSGPAGAVVGAIRTCGRAGYQDLITMDIGGTSLDVCLIQGGAANISTTREIDMFPVSTPMLDVHTVGAGGGSVVRVDPVGRVTVGPESMGARPGPACYGLGGDRATLTDINLLMGLLDPTGFPGGEVSFDRVLAKRAATEQICVPLHVDLETAVRGVYEVANNQISEAIRTITVEQGSDPRQFSLVAFGGGGPLHAAGVARELGIARILVPDHPGLFSAHGIAEADFNHDYVRSMIGPITEIAIADVIARFKELEHQAVQDLTAEGVVSADQEITLYLDMRYLGQTTEIQVPVGTSATALANGLSFAEEQFHELHKQRYSYNVLDEPVELVNLRLYALGRVARSLPQLPSAPPSSPKPDGTRSVLLPGGGGATQVPVYARSALSPGAALAGPALVEEASSTTLLLANMSLRVDPYRNLIIELEAKVGSDET